MESTIPFIGFSEPVSSWSHLFATVYFFISGFWLIQKGRGNRLRLFSLFLFTFSLVFLFSMSGVYHILEPGSTGSEVLKRLDHAAIWVLIAGSFTPVHIILLRGFWRWGFLIFIWTIAITGLVLKTVYFNSIPEWASIGMFLALGWMGSVTAWRVLHLYKKDRSIKLLLLSALSYTFGAILEYIRWPLLFNGVLGPHEIFHLFVILGAYLHWKWVYSWADCPVENHLSFVVTEFPGNFWQARARREHLIIRANSLEQLKTEIKKEVTRIYHRELPAESIHLHYTREEYLYGTPTTS